MTSSLVFQSTPLTVIEHQGQPWIPMDQLGLALGYGKRGNQIDSTFATKAVRNLYRRHADEFTDSMTQLIEIPENLSLGGELIAQIRIFSLRGCHLVAMFARTANAKAFRVWVLDVLDTQVEAEVNRRLNPPKALDTTSRLSKRSDPERKALAAVKSVWVSMAAIGYKDASALVNAHFGVSGVDEMTVSQCKEAVEWIQAKIDALQLAQQALPAAEEQAALPATTEEPPLVSIIRAKNYELQRVTMQIGNILREIYSTITKEGEPVYLKAGQGSDIRTIYSNALEAMGNDHRAIEAMLDGLVYHARIIASTTKLHQQQ